MSGARTLTAVLWGLALVYLVTHASTCWWDFRVYHRAAVVFGAGGDPYAAPYAVPVEWRSGYLPFVYPPGVLPVMAPLALVTESAAAWSWFLLKLGAAAWLVQVWRRSFGVVLGWPFWLLALFAFNAAAYTDLVSGNVAIFEALALWLALEAGLQERPWRAAVLVLACAAVKVQPVVFLLVIPVVSRSGLRPALVAAVAFAVGAAATYAWKPDWTRAWFALATSRAEGRATNPTTFELLREVAAHPQLAYALVVAGIAAVTARVRESGFRSAVLLVSALGLVLPRLSIYSHVLLLPCAWHAMRDAPGPLRVLLVLACVPPPTCYLFSALPLGALWPAVPPGAYAYLSTAAAWLVWIVLTMRSCQAADSAAT